MFTGIIRSVCPIVAIDHKEGLTRYAVQLPSEMCQELQTGASISIDGVCQTVVSIEDSIVWFDAIGETLKKTTIASFTTGKRVNIERSARFGDEIGGHILSGHIYGKAQVASIERPENNCIITFQGAVPWMKYLFSKGYIAINGASLTLVDVDQTLGRFTVHLIPETLQRTTFGHSQAGDWVNIEIDAQTQAVVDTVERIMQADRRAGGRDSA